ncbi:lipase family protein [Saccharothrix syringae]|uniref:Alpha/beta fold hydrolase n=1 Tax=Saccharothrix syringae TaxID=103733 RepID=A0A5Q0H8G4_SACSY|nr:lipase family protein [Saccharothrix syringae]QFZ22205.1 alpha/beta fold hydrolase [Saccharothrix syringae]
MRFHPGWAAALVAVLLFSGTAEAGAQVSRAEPAPGDVLRSAPSDFFLDPLRLLRAPATAHLVLYRSTDAHGRPVDVSGTVLTPRAAWRGPGPRPLVGYAPGTQGVADECAPSRQLAMGGEYEGPFIAGLLARGYGVVVTDYEGLGTPGVHTYVNRAAEGYAVLDAVRAAQRLPAADLPDDGPVAIAGYSQGGGASAAAVELYREYAPELDLKGAYAGAVPADLGVVARNLDGHYAAGFLGYALLGLDAAYPELDVPAVLNDAGRRLLAEVGRQCTAEAVVAHAFRRSTDLTADGRPLAAYLTEEPYASRVEEQRIGVRTPGAPVLVVHSALDDIVPYGQGAAMVRQWCARGATVEFSTSLAPTHVGGAVAAYPEAFLWLESRFAGRPARSTC